MLYDMAGESLPTIDVQAYDVRSFSLTRVQSYADAAFRALLPQHKIVLLVSAYTALGFVRPSLCSYLTLVTH